MSADTTGHWHEFGLCITAMQKVSDSEAAVPLPGAKSQMWPYAALVVGAVAMGASTIFVRLADVGPYASAFWRVALALPFLWIWMRIEDRDAPALTGNRLRQHWPILTLAGVLFAGDLFFWHLAIVKTSVANATLLATMTPIIVTLGAWLVLKERISGRVLLGVLLGVIGAGLLVGSSATFDPERLTGDIYGIVTAFFFGTYMLTVSVARRALKPATIMFCSTVVTTFVLFVIAIGMEASILPQSLFGVGILVALALTAQVGGQGLLAYAVGHLPAIFASLVMFLEALAAAAMAWVLFAETLTVIQALGGLAIFAGIYTARPDRGGGPA